MAYSAVRRGPALPHEAVAAAIQDFTRTFQIAEDGPRVTDLLMQLLRALRIGGRLSHDANIAATMMANDVPVIVSNDSDFRRFEPQIRIASLVLA